MPRDFDWRLIRCFLAALEHGSLLGAARALGSSQPTMGRYLAELETQLGVVLFERTGRGLKPTAAALALAEPARVMDMGALDLARRISGQQTELTGSVRISASEPVAAHLLPSVLRDMRLMFPHIQIELVASNAVSNLLRREADIALRMLRPQQATVIARKIGQVPLGVFAHRRYLERRGTPQQPEDLYQHDLIGNDKADNIIRTARQLGYTFQASSFALRCDSPMVQWQAVRAGLGLGFLGVFQTRGDPDLVRVLPSLRLAPLPMWLVVHREIRTNPRIRAVYDHLAQSLPALL